MPLGLDAVGTAGGIGFVEVDGSGGGPAVACLNIELEAMEDCISLGASYLQMSILLGWRRRTAYLRTTTA